MRYLGLIAELSTCRTDLDHLFQVCVTEMINRAAKKLLANELHQGIVLYRAYAEGVSLLYILGYSCVMNV